MSSQLAQLNNKIMLTQGSSNAKVRSVKRAQLTLAELAPLAEETVVYKAVGRAFIINKLPQIRSQLNDLMTRDSSEIANLNDVATRLIKQREQLDATLTALANKA